MGTRARRVILGPFRGNRVTPDRSPLDLDLKFVATVAKLKFDFKRHLIRHVDRVSDALKIEFEIIVPLKLVGETTKLFERAR